MVPLHCAAELWIATRPVFALVLGCKCSATLCMVTHEMKGQFGTTNYIFNCMTGTFLLHIVVVINLTHLLGIL